ncbi:MAG: hypothetical protein EXR51_01050 [Dehalococcoidia bacterium]|nr:hypothetical protein [Dehalococcoidia bacterium]
MSTLPEVPESPSEPPAIPADSEGSAGLLAELRREVTRLEAELDQRSQEIAGLHTLLRRTVPVAGAAPASGRNIGVMLTVLLGAPAVIIVLVVLLAVVKR